MSAASEPEDPVLNADPWIIDGMLPIAVAHAEAAAKAAGVTMGEWLSRLIADQTAAAETNKSTTATPETTGNPVLKP